MRRYIFCAFDGFAFSAVLVLALALMLALFQGYLVRYVP